MSKTKTPAGSVSRKRLERRLPRNYRKVVTKKDAENILHCIFSAIAANTDVYNRLSITHEERNVNWMMQMGNNLIDIHFIKIEEEGGAV